MDCDHIVQQKVEMGTLQEISVLTACMPKSTQIVVSCDTDFY